jgi:hypothetical protein
LAHQRLILWNCSMKCFASGHSQQVVLLRGGIDLPSDEVKVNWYLLVGPFGSLYPSQNTYGCNSLNCTVAAPTRFIQFLYPIYCVTNAVQIGIELSGPRRGVASKRTQPESTSLKMRNAWRNWPWVTSLARD